MSINKTSTFLASLTSLYMLAQPVGAASFNSAGQVVYDWDLTCEAKDCPDEWAAYERDVNKWIRKYGGNAGRETDWKKVREMARKSPGCVAEPQQMSDHWRIYLTDFVGKKVGKQRAKFFTWFSANNTASQDSGRKQASGAIMATCGYVGGAAGRAGVVIE